MDVANKNLDGMETVIRVGLVDKLVNFIVRTSNSDFIREIQEETIRINEYSRLKNSIGNRKITKRVV